MMLRYPISHETLFELTEAFRNDRRFICVGRVMLSYDPKHRRLTYRDGYGGSVEEVRLWHDETLSFDGETVSFESDYPVLEIAVRNQ